MFNKQTHRQQNPHSPHSPNKNLNSSFSPKAFPTPGGRSFKPRQGATQSPSSLPFSPKSPFSSSSSSHPSHPFHTFSSANKKPVAKTFESISTEALNSPTTNPSLKILVRTLQISSISNLHTLVAQRFPSKGNSNNILEPPPLSSSNGLPPALLKSFNWLDYIDLQSIASQFFRCEDDLYPRFQKYCGIATANSNFNSNFKQPVMNSTMTTRRGSVSSKNSYNAPAAEESFMNWDSFVNFMFDHGVFPDSIGNDVSNNFNLMRIFLSVSSDKTREKVVVVKDEHERDDYIDGGSGSGSGGYYHHQTNDERNDAEAKKEIEFPTLLRENCFKLRHLFRNMSSLSRQALTRGLVEESDDESDNDNVKNKNNDKEQRKQFSTSINKNSKAKTLLEMTTNVRYLLNAIGDNPLPGEFQYLMAKLRENYNNTLEKIRKEEAIAAASAVVAVDTSTEPASVNAPQNDENHEVRVQSSTPVPPDINSQSQKRKHQISLDLFLENDFIEAYMHAAIVANRVATIELSYEEFKTSILAIAHQNMIAKVSKEDVLLQKKNQRLRAVSMKSNARNSTKKTRTLEDAMADALATLGPEAQSGGSFYNDNNKAKTKSIVYAPNSNSNPNPNPNPHPNPNYSNHLLHHLLDNLLQSMKRDYNEIQLANGDNEEFFGEGEEDIFDIDGSLTPTDDLLGALTKLEATLTDIFDIYVTQWSEPNSKTISLDAFMVFLRDSKLCRKLTSKHIEKILFDMMDLDFESELTVDQFTEASDTLIKENYAEGCRKELLDWNSEIKLNLILRTEVRLDSLYKLYEMPNRAVNCKPNVFRAQRSSADISTAAKSSNRTSSIIDNWTGKTIEFADAETVDSFLPNHAMQFIVGSSTSANSRGQIKPKTEQEKRSELLGLIFDRGQARVDPSDLEEGQSNNNDDGGDDISPSHPNPNKNPSNSASTNNMTPKTQSTLAESERQKKKDFLSTAQNEFANTAHSATNSIMSVALLLGKLKFSPETQLNNDLMLIDDSVINIENELLNNNSVDEGGFSKIDESDPNSPMHNMNMNTNTNMGSSPATTNMMSPVPPNFSHTRSQTQARKKKIFKRRFGLSRGVQTFVPRMTTSNRDRLKFKEKLNKKCREIVEFAETHDLNGSAGNNNDQIEISIHDQHDVDQLMAHPSYRLFEEAMRIKLRSPEIAIGMLEKAMLFAIHMHTGGKTSSEHKMNLYNELVELCIRGKKFDQAADLMEEQLELVRQVTSDRTVEVNLLHQLGRIHYVMKHYLEAETCHSLQQNLAHQIFDHQGEMRAFYGTGMALQAMKRHGDASLMYKKYLDNAEANFDKREVAIAHGRLGVCYKEMGNYSESFASYKQQIAELRDILNLTAGDPAVLTSLAAAFGGIGVTYKLWGKLPLACNAFKKQIKISKDLGNDLMEAQTLYSLALVNVQLHLQINLHKLPEFFMGLPKAGLLDKNFGSFLSQQREFFRRSGLLRHVLILREVFLSKERDKFGSRGTNILNDKKLFTMLKSLDEGIALFTQILEIAAHSEEIDSVNVVSREIRANSLIYIGVLLSLRDGSMYRGNQYFDQCRDLLYEINEKKDAIALQMERSMGSGDSNPAAKKLSNFIHKSEISLDLNKNILLMLYGQWEIGKRNIELVLVEGGEAKYDASSTILYKSALAVCCVNTNDKKMAIATYEACMQRCEIERRGDGLAVCMLQIGELKFEQYREKRYMEDFHYAKELFSALVAWSDEVKSMELSVLGMVKLSKLYDYALNVDEGDLSEAEAVECEESGKELKIRMMRIRQASGDLGGATEIQAELLLEGMTNNMNGMGAGVSSFADR